MRQGGDIDLHKVGLFSQVQINKRALKTEACVIDENADVDLLALQFGEDFVRSRGQGEIAGQHLDFNAVAGEQFIGNLLQPRPSSRATSSTRG